MQFDLAVFANSPKRNSTYLHIYIEGDGQPFFRNRHINLDPTPRKGLMLDLMALDPTSARLVGRPCYHGLQARNCDDSKWWTSHRYSSDVVDSMSQAIDALNTSNKPVRLIGFSGGGALAMLIAPKLNGTNNEIITISANLDTSTWIRKHAYTPLIGSLNPIDFLGSVSSIKQTHLLGAQDKNIPFETWKDKVAHPKTSTVTVYSAVNHGCCWENIWSNIVHDLE